MATEKRLIRYDGLKQEIIDFKKGLNPKNTDYATGYFSALSVVEGMMVQHIATDAVEVVFCDYCVKHGGCDTEDVFRLARIEKPYCCAGKMDGDGNG